MEIKHDVEQNRAWTEKDALEAHVEYEVEGNTINITHTYVPVQLEGQGIASQLVKYVYDFGLTHGLKPVAACSYAVAWLKRHPAYK